MTTPQRSLLAALVAAGSTCAGLFWHRHHQFEEAARLGRENTRLELELQTRIHRSASAEHHEKRGWPGAPETASPAKSEDDAKAAAMSHPVEADYRNEGNASPQATLQTFAWACDQGDVAKIRSLIRFDEAARISAATYLAGLPKETRERWATPEAMAATLLVDAGIRNPFPHAAVLETVSAEQIPNERVKLHLSGLRRAESEYQLTSEGWKYAITSDAVDAYIAQSKNR